MKEFLKKVAGVGATIFGYGIFASLIIGGLTFVGYVVALIIGGEVATNICNFIYNEIYPILVTMTSIIVVLGLVVIYLRGEKALASQKKNKSTK